tara:strand:+ start:163 stop:687 length:525 start_codon:yes stop_codon:yes gene_type:complete
VRILKLIALGLSLTFSSPIWGASDPAAIIHTACSETKFDYRGKFEGVLNAAFQQDYNAFRIVNGNGKNDFAPEIYTLNDGRLSHGFEFAAFSGIQGKDENSPKILNWVPMYSETDGIFNSYRLFYVAIERSQWNDYSSQYQKHRSAWFVNFFDGCTLKSVQETNIPGWIGKHHG